jgi:predicted AlkP superfamily pyrophosphatase or phosphodiesterase
VRRALAAAALALAIGACAPALRARGPAAAAGGAPVLERVVIVSVDGLMPVSYTDPDGQGLRVPTLRQMVREGAHSADARSVFPSVTYPAHATIATGVDPGVHGITTNIAWDPREKNQEGWWWYAEDLKARPLWDAAAAAGLKTALVNWPCTVGARAEVLVPEYWRAGTADDVKLTRALATPGLLPAVAARFPDLWKKFTPPDITDEATADIVVHVLETARPRLLLTHIWQTDDAQHAAGPGSPRARAAIENADRQLGRIVAAARAAGPWERTAVVVVSDHGFTTAGTMFRPGVLLRDRGLVIVDDDSHPVSWKATVVTNGGLAFFYLGDPADRATAEALRELFGALVGRLGSGVERLYSAEEVRARGGDRRAILAIGAARGFTFGTGYKGEAYGPPKSLGQHGYDPDRADMRVSLLIVGGRIAPQTIRGGALVDVAPTVAAWLGLALPQATGHPLALTLRP